MLCIPIVLFIFFYRTLLIRNFWKFIFIGIKKTHKCCSLVSIIVFKSGLVYIMINNGLPSKCIDVVFLIDWVRYILLPAGPRGDSPTTELLKKSRDFCAL
jgi:hypothetical protein